MEKFCILTGIEIPEGGLNPQDYPLKKMCLNCVDCIVDENGAFKCKNEKVMEKGKEKILAAVPEGFEVDTLTLKPMSLKSPTKKCGNHKTNMESVLTEINKIFG